MIQHRSYVFFADIDNSLVNQQVMIVAIDNVPATYLPSDDSYFDEEVYEVYAKELSVRLMQKVVEEML